MRSILSKVALGACLPAIILVADPNNFSVSPTTYDPAHTNLVAAGWVQGIGCPTNTGLSTTGNNKPDTTYTDPACQTGDPSDQQNEGLLLAKTGPTGNYAAAIAKLNGVNNTVLTELGYDIRKPAGTPPAGVADPRGSHCGAGAPRFNVETTDGTLYFIGCASPAPVVTAVGNGWLRLRWGGTVPLQGYGPAGLQTITLPVKSISIVFDEGQDTGPDNFGAAILDNIDVNGVLTGKGGAH